MERLTAEHARQRPTAGLHVGSLLLGAPFLRSPVIPISLESM